MRCLRSYDSRNPLGRLSESACAPQVIATDMFTPKTIRRFTWHDNGAVYGAPDKKLDGTTHLDNVFLCGTDQGFVGIIGSIMSGISIANQHCLRD